MYKKLKDDWDNNLIKKSFEIIRKNSEIFEDWNKSSVDKLLSYMKTLYFYKNSIILKKLDKINFIGLIWSGNLIIKHEEEVIDYLGYGEIFGYMSFLNLDGNEYSNFDIIGQNSGYISFLLYDDYLNLQKREPSIFFNLNKYLCKKTFNLVSKQYLGLKEEIKSEFNYIDLNIKLAIEYLTKTPKICNFFNKIDKKDLRLILKISKFIEAKGEKKIASINTHPKSFLIVIKGEIMSYKNMSIDKIYKEGDILFINNYFDKSILKFDLYLKKKGILLEINYKELEELGCTYSQTAVKLLSYLTKFQCNSVKNSIDKQFFINKFKCSSIVEKVQKIKEFDIKIDKFLEIDIKNNQNKNDKNFNKTLDYDIFPLFNNKIFNKIDYNLKNNIKINEISQFLIDKLKEQKDKEKTTKLNSKLKNNNNKKTKNNVNNINLENEYDILKNEFYLLEENHNSLTKKHNDLLSQHLLIKNSLNFYKEEKIYLESKIRKFDIQKELLSKNLKSKINSMSSTNIVNNTRNFNDIFKEQIKFSRKETLARKYYFKWVNFVNKKKYN